jgi:putative acyl-CoA dehydrogenase
MVNFTRLDCINGSAACMRAAVTQAVHHAQHRSAFGKLLADQPLMQNVLADLAIESEAALLLLMRLARAVDRADANPQEALLKRLGTALGKYYVCKRAPAVVAEALECLGGNGYVEDSGMPRLFRESPLNSIWEGSGNINALDVLRILGRQPEAMAAFRAEIEPALDDARIASAASQLFALLPQAGEHDARTIAERMAQLWQAALFARVPHNRAAEAFIESRVARRHGATFGTLAGSTDLQAVVERAGPLQSVEYTQR